MSEGVDKGYFAEKEFLIPLKFIPLNFQHILMWQAINRRRSAA